MKILNHHKKEKYCGYYILSGYNHLTRETEMQNIGLEEFFALISEKSSRRTKKPNPDPCFLISNKSH